jgi:hypothetical protein
MAEAQAEARKFAELLRTLPERLRPIESVDLNIDALHDANVAGHAVNAVDAGTWHAVTPVDTAGPDLSTNPLTRSGKASWQPSTSIAISAKDLARGKWATTPR